MKWCTFLNDTGAVVPPGRPIDNRPQVDNLPYIFDAKQREVLDSKAKRAILNCSRQWGKSTVAAAKAVQRAMTEAGSLVLVASPTERQSAEFMRKAAEVVVG